MYLAKPGEMMLWTPGVPWNLPRCPAQVMPTQEAGERLGTGFSKDRVGQVRDLGVQWRQGAEVGSQGTLS